MPGIAIGNCIPFNRGGVNWSSYWAQQIKTSSDVNDAIMTEDEESFIVSEETVVGNATLYYLQTE